jgi:FkbM family methyltransferase
MTRLVIERLRRVLDYLESPVLFRARRRGINVGFVSDLVELRDSFGIRPSTIIDVGANRGDFSLASRFAFPQAHIIAFEPVPTLYHAVQARFASDSDFVIYPFALGDVSGVQNFHLANDTALSSLLPPGSQLRETFGAVHTNSTIIQVEAKRLDEVLELDKLPQPILLKVDVQGGELSLLRGASRQLERVACVKLEHSFEDYYRGQSRLSELFAFMEDHGFGSFLQADRNQLGVKIRWCDLVFFRG